MKAAIIGCGGRGNAHAEGYAAYPGVEIVAVADTAEEKAAELARKFKVKKVYGDYRELLDKHRPELVSVCTWPHTHLEIVEATAAHGARAIHAEKPMAPTWGESRRMHQVCVENNVQLTLCHQRRFSGPFAKARQLVRDGAIGELVRFEGYCPNLFDWGTHWFDMSHYFNQETAAQWVMGQVDCSEDRKVFGVPVETYGLSLVSFSNQVTALLVTGRGSDTAPLNRMVPREGILLHGTKGRIELSVLGGPALRVLREGAVEMETPEYRGVLPPGGDTVLSVKDMIDCLKSGQEPELSSFKALRATELIFATYESSRRRARVQLPLEIEDSPLLSMMESGEVGSL